MEETGLVGVFVLIYIDDVLIVGRGRARVREQAMRAVQALRAAGGVISPKSTLEPVTRLVWLGEDVDLGGGSLRTAGNAWEALLAHWLRLSVGVSVCGVCSSFWGARSGSVGLVLGIAPTCRGSGPMCYGDPPACSLPLSTCCALCVWRVYWLCRASCWYP